MPTRPAATDAVGMFGRMLNQHVGTIGVQQLHTTRAVQLPWTRVTNRRRARSLRLVYCVLLAMFLLDQSRQVDSASSRPATAV